MLKLIHSGVTDSEVSLTVVHNASDRSKVLMSNQEMTLQTDEMESNVST